MANNQMVSQLQLYKTRSFTGLSESNHLSNAFLTQPHEMGMLLSYEFGYRYNNILNLITGGIGNTMTVTNREYNWMLHSQTDRAIDIIGNLSDGGTTPGKGGSTFRVKTSEKWFTESDILVTDDGTRTRVQTQPYQDGNGWVYTLQLTTSDNDKFIDVSQISAGSKLYKDYSAVGEFSDTGGDTHFYTPFKLQNCLNILRKKYDVTASAATDLLVLELPSPEDPKKTSKLWTRLAEWNAMSQFYAEIDKSLIYSEYNKDVNGLVKLAGDNGRPVYQGAGLREQIAPANRRYYSELSYKMLQDFLMDLSYSAQAWGGDTKFLALTGKMGMIEFDRAITEKASSLGFMVVNEGRFISGKGMELTFEGQFRTVKFPNGIELTVKEFPPYDDLIRNRTLHPTTKRPIESYRFTILNIGRKDGESNIKKVVKKDREMVLWHEAGSMDPTGNSAKSINTMRSSSKDGYAVHMLSECGIMLTDPTSCGELIMSLD